MKSKHFILAAIMLAMPSTIMAQQNIQNAFDALLNEKITETKTQHILERDPETGRKSAQADVYDFTVTGSSALERIKDICKAFDKDKDTAYKINSDFRKDDGFTSDSDVDGLMGTLQAIRKEMYPMTLIVGDGKSHQSVAIGAMKNSSYIYACFSDKDDPENKYRYAYAMEWVENSKKTQVRLAVTYGLRPEVSEKKSRTRIVVNGKEVNVGDQSFAFGSGFPFGNGSVFDVDSVSEKSPEAWLSEFNNYKRLFLKNPDGYTATHYATTIYKLCKNAEMLEPEEKKIVAQELAKLKNIAKDELIQNVFLMSIKKLGE